MSGDVTGFCAGDAPCIPLRSSGDLIRRVANMSKGTDVKLTVDSSEPLEDAMRVLGALYGVTLVVASDRSDVAGAEQDARKPADKRAAPGGRRPTAARRTRPAARASDAVARKPKQGTAARLAGSPSSAEVRSWARDNGMTVSDRGRVPASVMTAYRNAHDL